MTVLETFPLGFPFKTFDPFLFCVHHDDRYPRGNDVMGPDTSLAGRNLGSDFVIKDGFRMYHGRTVPGFPKHPHRGFETVTLVRKGRIDHSDSLGAKARFGGGDVQWMTAGHGIEHAEMFPLLDKDGPNHVELFQLWLNLPSKDKHVPAHFKMLWADTLPSAQLQDGQGHGVELGCVAGDLAGSAPPSPPPHSWAANPDHRVIIATIKLAPAATYTLPADQAGLNRALYAFVPGTVTVAGQTLEHGSGMRLRSDVETVITCGPRSTELLLLQGKPIGEPVVQHGPFVMNTRDEIREAIADYRRGVFGSWSFDRNDPVHPREQERFAVHPDGTKDQPA